MSQSELPPQLAAQAAAGPPGLSDALRIWWAGVSAVTPERLFASEVRVENNELIVGDHTFSLRGIRRIVVVGAGKASAAMASALVNKCFSRLPRSIEVVGWVNAPEASFSVGSAGPVHLHAARPPGINEPTAAAVEGTGAIMRLVGQCDAGDLCIALLSGGGSALLAQPIDGITLADKQAIARKVAAAGGNIQQLNTVRRALSRVKGGGLARHCHARHLISLIISDVLGDPLETIASGPTVVEAKALPQEALEVLAQLGLLGQPDLENVISVLRRSDAAIERRRAPKHAPVSNIILANNATAVDAAGVKAVELGYRYIMQVARTLEGDVAQLAERVGQTLEGLAREPQVDCWISGGEPTVKLPAADICGRGGRNQQLTLLSLLELERRGWPGDREKFPVPLLFLSAGTDGEDGPTTAAGAWFTEATHRLLSAQGIDAAAFAQRADAYPLLEQLGCLIHSGPTGTNVCDLRIALKLERPHSPGAAESARLN
ncbi:MAG: glycerate kinase type-2 family protein [Aureliella sp.]